MLRIHKVFSLMLPFFGLSKIAQKSSWIFQKLIWLNICCRTLRGVHLVCQWKRRRKMKIGTTRNIRNERASASLENTQDASRSWSGIFHATCARKHSPRIEGWAHTWRKCMTSLFREKWSSRRKRAPSSATCARTVTPTDVVCGVTRRESMASPCTSNTNVLPVWASSSVTYARNDSLVTCIDASTWRRLMTSSLTTHLGARNSFRSLLNPRTLKKERFSSKPNQTC